MWRLTTQSACRVCQPCHCGSGFGPLPEPGCLSRQPGHGPYYGYGAAPTLRHIKRTHSVSISWLNERVLGPDITLHDCISEVMAAYIFTKRFVNREKWEQVCMLIAVCTNTHMSKLKPFKPCSPACVAVAHTALSPAMSGAASSTDVNAYSAKPGTVTPTTRGTITDAPSAKAGAAVNRWTSARMVPRPEIEDVSDDFVPLHAYTVPETHRSD